MAMAMTSNNRWFSRAADDWRWGVRRLQDPSLTKKDRRAYSSQESQAWHRTMVLAYRDRPSGGAIYRYREGFSFFLANSHNREERGLTPARGRTTLLAEAEESRISV